ncbi:hypothetical protein NN561_015282 [Cricetulus griseus]
MLLALGALPGNSRIPMGSGSEWPRAPRVEPEEQRPELLTAAARVRKPVGHPHGSAGPLQEEGSGSRWQNSAAPPRLSPPAPSHARSRAPELQRARPAVRSGATGA